MVPRFVLGLALSFALSSSVAAQTLPPQHVDRLIRAALEQWQVPGLAAVIVHNDRIVYLKGHGVKELGRDDVVRPDTVFPLASCTKPFTTLAMAMLADEGKLGWDDPVRKHLPKFHLADPSANAGCTLRDLVCHRTGIGGHELLWYHSPWSPEERLDMLSRVEQAHPFRSRFEYQTILFGAAGLAAGRAAGKPWDELVRQRILEPLGMESASCTFPADADLASPHRKDAEGKVRRLDRYPLTRPDPAGSIHASARDLATFLRFELGDGTWHGRRLVSTRNLRETQTSQVVLRLEGFAREMNPETEFLTYGLGWIVQDYRGKRILMHGGAIDGFRAHFTLVPDAHLGIAFLNNLDGCFLNLALSNALIDLVLEQPTRDWSTFYLDLQNKDIRIERERAQKLRTKKTGRPPTQPLDAYVGSYEEAAYGRCDIALRDGRLIWKWANFDLPMEPFDGDLLLINHHPLSDALFTFDVDDRGRVTALHALDRVFRRRD